MTCGLEGQKHMAVDNFLSLCCQSGVTPHLRSLWWCQPKEVAECQSGIRYAGQVAKRERGTLAWHRNERHANCFPVCCRARLSGLLNHRVERRFLFPSLSVWHTCCYLSVCLSCFTLSNLYIESIYLSPFWWNQVSPLWALFLFLSMPVFP